MRLVAGLGNPGKRYALTRHNIGFMVVDRLAADLHVSFSRQKFKARLASGLIADEEVILIKPQNFMNLSGDAIGPLVRFYKLELSSLLVIYDDIDLPFGRMRLRPAGGSGGHKGMASIISRVGSHAFPRLRIGIRGEDPVGNLSDYVLSEFTSEEKSRLGPIIERACTTIRDTFTLQFDMVMNKYNEGGAT